MGRLLQVCAAILYFGVGIVQLLATLAGIEHWLGVSTFIAFLLSAFTAYIPLVGTVLGMFGAVQAWGWSWAEAAALFFGVFVVNLALLGAASGLDALHRRA